MKQIVLIIIVMFGVFACSNEKPKEDLAGTGEYYTCSMDPQVVEYKPGNCPICKMPLTKVKKNMGLMADEIELSDQQLQLGNVTVQTVSRRSLSDQSTISAIVKVNETLLNSVSAKVMGRIDKLYFKNPGDLVKQGDLVFELYSEELNVMKQEYQQALKSREELNGTGFDFKQTLQAARAKLLLNGLNEMQIARLEKDPPSTLTAYYSPFTGYISEIPVTEGQYLMLGQEIMKLADLSSLWVEAQAFNSRIGTIKPGDKVQIVFPGSEIKDKEGEIEFINPVSMAASRLTQFRAKVDNSDNLLKPGMVAYIDLLKTGNEVLAVSENAVIRNGKEATVWIKTAKNKFRWVKVELGEEANGFIEIKSGISVNDEIVVTGAYLINSEFVFKKGAVSMEEMSN